MPAWTEDKSDYSSDCFNENLEQVPDEYSVEVFNAEMGEMFPDRKLGMNVYRLLTEQ
jgi:hypothetical protein